MTAVEICIRCDGEEQVRRDVEAAFAGGAARIELCGQMEDDGLTPADDLVRAARAVFRRDGLVVMVRPRAGGFVYTPGELREMAAQIERAAELGADGVVLGALCADGAIDRGALADLVDASRAQGLQVALHRAFDAMPDPVAAVDGLIELGVERVLTSGMPWSVGGGALEGGGRLRQTVERSAGRIEVAVGGGVNPENAAEILQPLRQDGARLSVHAYSGVQVEGRVRVERVAALVAAVDRL